ncbi:pro-FMRFamide-related neuropeptide FF [Pipra filicauda]|uniref:Pro-FMRFamide-related neuropeptide FF n=1 Tax=Pipra filicauda TaxID=649802 RepID=A0A7R5L398_9PASS|nr:pro-FMRFamide-related neuropeptide FF [Pipra filicauda]
MTGRPALLLMLLLLAETPRSARCCPGTLDPAPAAAAAPPGPPPAAAALGALLRSLQRPGRAPGTLLQPQRSGWGPQGGAQARLSPRSWDPPLAPFWTMATPQRFGRRR